MAPFQRERTNFYSICYFGSLIRFAHFIYYASGGTLLLASPVGPSLIFYHSDFWTTFFLWKTELPWNFSLWWNSFHLSGLLRHLWIALKNRVCPEFTGLNIYSNLIIQNFDQLAHALKNRVYPEIFHCIELFLSFRIFEEVALALKTECVMKFFIAINILVTFRMFEQLLLALKNSVSWIHCIECIFHPSEFWTTCACLKKELALKIFTALK